MKTLKNENQKWSVSLKTAPSHSEEVSRPEIGDDDGISNQTMNTVILLFMLLTLGISIAVGQSKEDVKHRILLRQAMLDMDRLEYSNAIIKLLEVRANTPENANVDHMIGMCYLYGDGASDKAVFYLNRAAKNASSEHESWDLDETRAPIEASYHLAKAYEKSENYAKAAEFYGQFLASVSPGKITEGSRTYAIIQRSAQECEAIALQQQQATDSNINVVFNK